MNTNTETPTKATALYYRATDFGSIYHCGEPVCICPECGWNVCVFCESACESCGTDVWPEPTATAPF